MPALLQELVLHTVAANSVLLSSLLRQGIHQVDKMGIVINYTMPGAYWMGWRA